MDTTHIPTLKQMADFVSGGSAVELHCHNRQEAYSYIERVLVAFSYSNGTKLKKPEKGIVRAYLAQVTGFGSAQLSKLTKIISQTTLTVLIWVYDKNTKRHTAINYHSQIPAYETGAYGTNP
jgi:hypothetical protein